MVRRLLHGAASGRAFIERVPILAMQLPVPGEGLRALVRVLGVRREKFVAFSFAVNDEDLSVELLMPLDAFLEFRDRYRAEMLLPEPAAALAFDDLMRRNARS